MARRKAIGAGVLFGILAILVCGFSLHALQQAGGGSDYVASLWVGEATGISKIAVSDGASLLRITDVAEIRAIAVDERRGRLWAYGQCALNAFSFNGDRILSLLLDPEGNGECEHVALVTNPADGSVWLGVPSAPSSKITRGMLRALSKCISP